MDVATTTISSSSSTTTTTKKASRASNPEIYEQQKVPQKENNDDNRKHRNASKSVTKKMSIPSFSTMFSQKHSDSRRNSKSGSASASPSIDLTPSVNKFLPSRSIDIEYETMLKKLSGQYDENGREILIVESEVEEFRIEGYALKSIISNHRKISIQEEEEEDTAEASFAEIKNEDIEETAREYTYYVKHFKDKEHTNYYGILESPDESKQYLFVLSVKYDWDNHKYTLILRTKDGNLFNELDTRDQEINGKSLDPKHFNPEHLMMPMFDKVAKEIKQAANKNAFEQVSAYDKNLFKQTFTFGIIYQKYGQISEKEIFSNTENSKEFEEFLDFIGQRVTLKNFKKFRGGLDVQDDVTGIESIYENHDGAEIMFHVSTFLPHSEKDQQFVERKRHIGNDRVAIVFQDRETLFSPKIIRSKLLHVFIIVQPVIVGNETKQYKISVITRKEVPIYDPEIRAPYIFNKDDSLKRFLLTKLINADYASLRAPAFLTFSDRTIESSLKNLYDVLATPSPVVEVTTPSIEATNSSIANESDQKVPTTIQTSSSSNRSDQTEQSSDVNNSIQRMRTTFRKLVTTRLHHNPHSSGGEPANAATRKSLDQLKQIYDENEESGGRKYSKENISKQDENSKKRMSLNENDYFSDSGISRRETQDKSTVVHKKNKNNFKRRSGSVADAVDNDSTAAAAAGDELSKQRKPRCESVIYTMGALNEVSTPPSTPIHSNERRNSELAIKSAEIKTSPSEVTITPEKSIASESKDSRPKSENLSAKKDDVQKNKSKTTDATTENESESASKTSWKRAIKSFFKLSK